MTKIAVHYSQASSVLFAGGHIVVDRFKCPAWPDLIATMQGQHVAYVHFPLKAGAGNGDAIDTETNQPAD